MFEELTRRSALIQAGAITFLPFLATGSEPAGKANGRQFNPETGQVTKIGSAQAANMMGSIQIPKPGKLSVDLRKQNNVEHVFLEIASTARASSKEVTVTYFQNGKKLECSGISIGAEPGGNEETLKAEETRKACTIEFISASRDVDTKAEKITIGLSYSYGGKAFRRIRDMNLTTDSDKSAARSMTGVLLAALGEQESVISNTRIKCGILELFRVGRGKNQLKIPTEIADTEVQISHSALSTEFIQEL